MSDVDVEVEAEACVCRVLGARVRGGAHQRVRAAARANAPGLRGERKVFARCRRR